MLRGASSRAEFGVVVIVVGPCHPSGSTDSRPNVSYLLAYLEDS
jgi:hypothetical protein